MTARNPLARTDKLTGLPNLTAWTDALESERVRRSRYRRPVVLMTVDVNGPAETNRRRGDELRVAAADVLRRNLRDADLVARIGEDEFGVMLPETQAVAMDALLARIHASCAEWRGTDPELRLSVSIGWAVPEPFGDLREALRAADERMHLAKRGA